MSTLLKTFFQSSYILVLEEGAKEHAVLCCVYETIFVKFFGSLHLLYSTSRETNYEGTSHFYKKHTS